MLLEVIVFVLVSSCFGQLEVQTAYGTVRGVRHEQGHGRAFMNIPYAAPPVGQLRWAAPAEPHGWKGVLDLSQRGLVKCPQIDVPPFSNFEHGNKSEDCLVLNVWTPVDDTASDRRLRPVMVYVHGGGFWLGTGNNEVYNMTNVAQFGDVVGVTINYRLSWLGFLSHPGLAGTEGEGNYGFLDQQAALRWVKQNIRAFGGDPERVTLFGESAGAASVMMHLLARGSKDLFHRAILQSTWFGGMFSTLEESRQNRAAHAERIAGCQNADAKKALECLRSKPVSTFVDALSLGPIKEEGQVHSDLMYPTYDERVFYGNSLQAFRDGNFNRVPIIIGHNEQESAFALWFVGDIQEPQFHSIVRYNYGTHETTEKLLSHFSTARFGTVAFALSQFMSHPQFVCGSRELARAYAALGLEAYYYLFNFISPTWGSSWRSAHFAETYYPFRTLRDGMDVWGFPRVMHEYDDVVTEKMSRYWVDFAHGHFLASAQSNGQLAWPPYSDNGAVMMMGGLATPGFGVTYGDPDYACGLFNQNPNYRLWTTLRTPPSCDNDASGPHCFAKV